MSYELPIEIIRRETEMQVENEVYKEVQKYDIRIDKEEMIKALNYDRGQYEKGYWDSSDKYERALDKILREILPIIESCSGCPCYHGCKLDVASKDCIERIKEWGLEDE